MTYFPSLAIAFLEISFITLLLLMLRSARKYIGTGAFHLSFGMLFVFSQIINASQLKMTTGLIGWNVDVGTGFIICPFLVCFLLIYIADGVVETQRIIIGMLIAMLAYLYIANITARQCLWPGYTVGSNPVLGGIMSRMFLSSRRYMTATFIALLLDMLVLPVMYQLFRNRNFSLFISLLGTLVFTQVVDSFVFALIMNPLDINWWWDLRGSFIVRGISMLWLSLFLWVYLRASGHFKRVKDDRSIFEIISHLFGSFSRARSLQQNISEWEGRYRMLVENSNDLIFLVDKNGLILNTNPAAVKSFGFSIDKMQTLKIPDFMKNGNNSAIEWSIVWNMVYGGESSDKFFQTEWCVEIAKGEKLLFYVNISPVTVHDQEVLVIVCRDISERVKMQQERERLREQLIHAQKMEAVGQLAGGIAHDFNNVLHSIQANVDVLQQKIKTTPENKERLKNIGISAHRVSDLTNQLLGFARKGKFNPQLYDLKNLLQKVKKLFSPLTTDKITFKLVVHPDAMQIKADDAQLEQVLLNILINARDALEQKEDAKIILRAEPAEDFLQGSDQKIDKKTSPQDYVCIRIKDNGPGISDEIMEKIFDPFFTTKDFGKGTGMGLAMAYGSIANHKGWIHVSSSEKGTEFFIYLPKTTA
ncbi:MAG: ATP-binding protein [Verrucomicrobiota bacterium]|nr:ATP-binding protein [Verrucomicrobiota bacterium]